MIPAAPVCRFRRRYTIAAWCLAGIVLLCLSACGDRMADRMVVQNNQFTLTGDSLIEGGIIATAATPLHIESSLTRERLDSIAAAYSHAVGHDAERVPAFTGGKPWRSSGMPDGYPAYHSRQRLLEAVYNMSVDHIAEASTGDTFIARGDTVALYCAMALSLAWIDPVRTQATLRSMVNAGTVAPLHGWPFSATHLIWAEAAWCVYTATGDRQWLAEMHNVLVNTLQRDSTLLTNPSLGLLQGGSTLRGAPFFPAWFTQADAAQAMTLHNNVLAFRACQILDEVDEELQLNHTHAASAQVIKGAVNQHLWSEYLGRYAAYIYGALAPMRAPVTDNAAQALAIMGDVADDDRAATLLAKTPIAHKGIALSYPDTAAVEPYFSHPCWPAVQALWVLAAARLDNEDMVRRGMAALVRAQALFQSRHITLPTCTNNDLLTSASSVAVTLRVLMGLRLMSDGFELSPMVPASMSGGLSIDGFRYRGASFDITVHGTGNDVAAMTIDGKKVEGNFIPATFTGHHRVEITLRRGRFNNGVTIASGAVALPATPDVVWTADSGCIVNYVAGGAYRFVVDGHLEYSVSSMAFALPQMSGGVRQVAVAMAGKHGFGFISLPTVVGEAERYSISVAPLVSDTITADVVTTRSGPHLLQLDYRSLRQSHDAFQVSVNTHHQGTVLLPASGDGDASSTQVTVNLLRGTNHLVLSRPPYIPAATIPITLRLIKK